MNNIVIYPATAKKFGISDITANKKCFGIDLGTTTTIMCVVEPENVDLSNNTKIPIQFIRVYQESPFEYDSTIEDEKVASIVAIHNGKPYVGNNLSHLKGHPDFEYKKNMFYHWKLELGVDQHPMYPNAVIDKLDMPYKIAGGILNYIRRARFKDIPLANTIITVPASFQANQRKDVLRAAEMAKIETAENMLIDEPNAAFLGYFNRLNHDDKAEWARNVNNKNVLIIDFGGGTLDLSILNIDFKKDTGIVISNVAISRYNDLGGQDIDNLIAEEFLVDKLKDVYKEFDSTNISEIRNIVIPQLALIGEDLKVGICNKLNLKAVDQDINNINIDSISFTRTDCKIKLGNYEYDLGDITITANIFKALFVNLFKGRSYKFKYIDKTVSTISTSISDIIEKAQLTLDNIQYVLFVGGSSFNPLLHTFCREKLSNATSLTSHEPDKLVAEGAAVYSYFLNIHQLSLISPITSDHIGVVLKDKRFYPIIERGKSLPQKVDIPNFKLQTNLLKEIVVPVCINGVDFPIGEIRAPLNDFYDINSIVKIQAEISIDKVFKMKVFVNNDLIGDAEFHNPYENGKLSEEELEVHKIKRTLNQAKIRKDIKTEKTAHKDIIDKYYDIGNFNASLEAAEEYVKRFDDQDDHIWNMIFCCNNSLGRLEAAKAALLKGLELSPQDTILHYNFSILLGRSSSEEALKYLENLSPIIKKDKDIKCRIICLKSDTGVEVRNEALEIVNLYKSSPYDFSLYSKRVLLPKVFKIAGQPYSFIDPKVIKNKKDESKYLDTNNLPI